MGYYSAISKNEILSFVTTWMDLEGIMLSKISQTEWQIQYDGTVYGKWKPEQMNQHNQTVMKFTLLYYYEVI